jgi:epsilon-lactone hydrolase
VISPQARFIKLFLRLTVKRRMQKPSKTPMEGIRKLRASLGRYDGVNRRFTRGLAVVPSEGLVRGEWLLPSGEPRDRAILFVHGGAFVACTPQTHRPLTTALAKDSGVPVFAVDYRLAPEHPFPAALDDVLAAYDMLVGRGIPPSGIVLAGDSAGGGLVLSAALALKNRGGSEPTLAGVIAYSPWTDLLATGKTLVTNAKSDDMLVGSGVGASARNYVHDDALLADPLASPLYGDLRGLPPLLVFASTVEILLDDSRRFVERARAAGTSVDLVLEPGMPHVWQIFVDLLPEAKRSVARSVAFVRSVLEPRKRVAVPS